MSYSAASPYSINCRHLSLSVTIHLWSLYVHFRLFLSLTLFNGLFLHPGAQTRPVMPPASYSPSCAASSVSFSDALESMPSISILLSPMSLKGDSMDTHSVLIPGKSSHFTDILFSQFIVFISALYSIQSSLNFHGRCILTLLNGIGLFLFFSEFIDLIPVYFFDFDLSVLWNLGI